MRFIFSRGCFRFIIISMAVLLSVPIQLITEYNTFWIGTWHYIVKLIFFCDDFVIEIFFWYVIQVKLHWIIFVTGWMSFRAVGSGLFLFWIFTENERSAPSEWIVPFVGDFFIGITALFLVYHIIKKPSTILWGLLLSWNVIGLLDLIGAINVSFAAPYGPIPEIGFNELVVRFILSLNTLFQISCIYLLFQKDIKEYFKF